MLRRGFIWQKMQKTKFKKRKPSNNRGSRPQEGNRQEWDRKPRKNNKRPRIEGSEQEGSRQEGPDRGYSERSNKGGSRPEQPRFKKDRKKFRSGSERSEQAPEWARPRQSRFEQDQQDQPRSERWNSDRSRPDRSRPKKRRNERSRRTSGRDLSMYIHTPGEVKEKAAQYEPEHSFEEFHVNQDLLQRIKQKGFTAPSEIQDKAIPVLLQGDDLIGVAGTGTGKTAAFLIPIIDRLLEEPEDQSALIIAPTRELASQINDEFRSLVKGLGIYSTCLIGGLSVRDSIQALKRTNHIVIGTPGRLLDMHDRGLLDLENFETLVLDEFDRMLDMGFSDEMRMINKEMVNKQQTMLFSATVDPSQRKLINEIAGGAQEVQAAMNTQKTDAIHQDVLHVRGQDKFQLMHDLIAEQEEEKVILFCETKRKADEILKRLKNEDIRADVIHGDKTQNARQTALRKFKRGNITVLVATDVVARGIDVSDVALVINYEPPRNYTDYVHRIGRTGRAGKTGRAITMIG